MKISVLLPTRDRLELLHHAVASVLRQADDDWEIVISDNASKEDVAGYASSLGDPRIVCVRGEQPVSVTDNWNRSLEHSSGEYVIMLGDDDALLDGYFLRTRELIAQFERPDIVYHNALVYAYPGVLPDEPAGYLRSEGYARFLQGAERAFLLPRKEATDVAHAAMDFRLLYGFNMQFATISRSIVEQLSERGPFFRSPFPDYYAMNHLFLRAHSIVIEPRPLVVIGVSPRSYGFFHENRRETEGRRFLSASDASSSGASSSGSTHLPGTNINDGWLAAIEELHRELGSEYKPRPNLARYRMLQIAYVYDGHHLRGTIDDAQLAELRSHLTHTERFRYDVAFGALRLIERFAPPRLRSDLRLAVALAQRQFPHRDPGRDPSSYNDILDVVERIDPERYPAVWERQNGSRWRRAVLRLLGSRMPARARSPQRHS